ncbi:MAG: cation:proton antiporter [Candidatus Tectimicrobiota bacterium]|nr:MAG: cation:proton antiporter [Candidatus Tectomicrobia bacterium]
MRTVLAQRPLLAVLVSLVAAGLILLSHRRPRLRESWTFLAAALKFLLVLSMLPAVQRGEVVASAPLVLYPGLALHLRADALGTVFALLASALWLLTSLYSVGYLRAGHARHQTGYFACFAVCLAATMGIAFAANLLTFFVFYELLTLATYPLVAHERTAEALAAGRRYLAYTLGGGQLLLVAVVGITLLAPGAEFQPGGFLAGRAPRGVLALLLGLALAGVGVKAALMPLHGWLPAAMVAPTPVSALLHAVAVVKAGVFGCLRLAHYVFGASLLRELHADVWLAGAAALTILLGSLRALGESNLKRRLAYSTVSQLSYIVLGAALSTPAALAGAVFHIAAHGLLKITLFFCAGAVYVRTHQLDIAQLAGLGRQMPITFGAFALGALGLAGTPLLAGFVSKWNLGLGALQAGHAVFLGVLVASGLLNFAYFFPIVYSAFFSPAPAPGRWREVSPALWLPLATTALLAVVLGLFPNAGGALYRLSWQVAERALSTAGPLLAGGGP